ncbi:MAG: putative sugar kinase [Verrucomicrobiales bacterium]|nr:putative sugar kinase [Verrucomicrobiales bacterium]
MLKEAATFLASRGKLIFTEPETGQLSDLHCPILSSPLELARNVDILLVFGGDGTILRVVRETEGVNTPVLGINAGRLGFLTAIPGNHLAEALERLLKGEYSIEHRPLIEAIGTSMGQPMQLQAMNDFVISRGASQRMIELELSVNGELVTVYRCDGLIVSSPTGSTAYSLSAGGAIIAPNAEVFCITPICPHTLSNRSLVLNLDATIQVHVVDEKTDTTVAADGQVQLNLSSEDYVIVRKSSRSVHLVQLHGNTFFQTVRKKLNWSGSTV